MEFVDRWVSDSKLGSVDSLKKGVDIKTEAMAGVTKEDVVGGGDEREAR